MARSALRGTFSPTGPRRPAAARRLTRTLGLALNASTKCEDSFKSAPASLHRGPHPWRMPTPVPPEHSSRCRAITAALSRVLRHGTASSSRNSSTLRLLRGLTPRSTGRATAGHLGPVGGTLYIFANRAKAACRSGPVNSNVRPHKRRSSEACRGSGGSRGATAALGSEASHGSPANGGRATRPSPNAKATDAVQYGGVVLSHRAARSPTALILKSAPAICRRVFMEAPPGAAPALAPQASRRNPRLRTRSTSPLCPKQHGRRQSVVVGGLPTTSRLIEP